MANRSDFFNTSEKCPRLPRYLKKMLALNSQGAHQDGEVRRLFIKAHQTHVAFKLKRGNEEVTDTGVEE
jgi:hypothetical protein